MALKRYADDPFCWAEDRFGVRLWSKQREIAEAVVGNRHTTVRAAHGVGMSYLTAVLAAWWVETREDPMVVFVAPTVMQLRYTNWLQLRNFAGYGELQYPRWMRNGQLVAVGTSRPGQVSGICMENTLVLVDDAGHVHRDMWNVGASLTPSGNSRFLAVGSPYVLDVEERMPEGLGTLEEHVDSIEVPLLCSPNFTGEPVAQSVKDRLTCAEWQADKLDRWGGDSPLYRSKVLATA